MSIARERARSELEAKTNLQHARAIRREMNELALLIVRQPEQETTRYPSHQLIVIEFNSPHGIWRVEAQQPENDPDLSSNDINRLFISFTSRKGINANLQYLKHRYPKATDRISIHIDPNKNNEPRNTSGRTLSFERTLDIDHQPIHATQLSSDQPLPFNEALKIIGLLKEELQRNLT